MTKSALPSGDYISPNLERVWPDDAFPNMVSGDKATSTWPYLRRDINHNWYVDRRNPTVGFVSRDEAAILYNTARVFDGRPCLEIGCWRGWSTVHIALGTHSLDSIDPILGDLALHGELVETLRRAGVEDRVSLHASRSPEGVEEIAARTGKRWSFAFIDGDHAGDAPLVDAEVVQRFAAEDALIILHDLAAPEPAAALAHLRDHGWTTALYQTMQIMGVATRGKCRPVAHIPDRAQTWSLPRHLSSFAVVGESHRAAIRRITIAMGRRTADAPPESSTADAEALERAAMEEALQAAEQTANALQAARCESQRLARGADLTRSFDDLQSRYLRLAETFSSQKVARAALETDLADARGARDASLADSHRLRVECGQLTSLLDSYRGVMQKITVAMGRPTAEAPLESWTAAGVEALERAFMQEALHAAEQTANALQDARAESLRLAKGADVVRSFDDLHARYAGLIEAFSTQKAAQAVLEADLADARSARDAALADNQRLQSEHSRLVRQRLAKDSDLARSFDDLRVRYASLVETISTQKAAQAVLEADLTDARTAGDAALADSHRLRTTHGRLKNLLNRADRLSKKLLKTGVAVDGLRKRHVTARVVDEFSRSICRPRVLLGLARRTALGKDAETRQILGDAFSAHGATLPMSPSAIEWLSRSRTLFGLLRRRLLAGSAAAEGVLTAALRAHRASTGGVGVRTEQGLANSTHELAEIQQRLDGLTVALRAQLASADVGVGVPAKKGVADPTHALATIRQQLDEATAQLTAEKRRVEETEQKLRAVENAMVADERALYDAQIELTKLRRGVRLDDPDPVREPSLGASR